VPHLHRWKMESGASVVRELRRVVECAAVGKAQAPDIVGALQAVRDFAATAVDSGSFYRKHYPGLVDFVGTSSPS
jgi:hypothetical protein